MDERQALFKQKVRSGKSAYISEGEIRRDEDYVFNLNRDIKLLQKTNLELQLKLKEKEEVIKTLRKDLFAKDSKRLAVGDECSKQTGRQTATISQLNRILSLLEEENMNRLQITNACNMDNRQAMPAILFLKHHKIIDENSENKFFLIKLPLKDCDNSLQAL